MTPVHIGTKPYIAAWLDLNMPDKQINSATHIGLYTLSIMSRARNKRKTEVYQPSYAAKVTLYISKDLRLRQGGWLNVTQTFKFNKYVGGVIKAEIRTHIICYLRFDPRLNRAIEYAREMTGLTPAVLADDAIIKDFQRWRESEEGKKKNVGRIYKKVAA